MSTSLLDAYRIRKLLGRGGMAEVLLAGVHHEGREQLVALKRIRPGFSGQSEYRKLFEREASIARRISHPNIARVLDYQRQGNEQLLVMEYVHGRTLKELVVAASRNGGVRMAALLTIFRDVAMALHHVHEVRGPFGKRLGLIHRDLNPNNVLLRGDGVAKLVDFGIARTANKSTTSVFAAPSLDTLAGGPMKGSLGYMSPEQCRCDRLDRRSDIFSLGVLLYEATLCRRAFSAYGGIAAIGEIVSGRLPRPRSIDPRYPKALEAIVRRAMASNPKDRFASAGELARAIERFASRHKLVLSRREVAAELDRLVPVDPLPKDVTPWIPPHAGRRRFPRTRAAPRSVRWAPRPSFATSLLALGTVFIVGALGMELTRPHTLDPTVAYDAAVLPASSAAPRWWRPPDPAEAMAHPPEVSPADPIAPRPARPRVDLRPADVPPPPGRVLRAEPRSRARSGSRGSARAGASSLAAHRSSATEHDPLPSLASPRWLLDPPPKTSPKLAPVPAYVVDLIAPLVVPADARSSWHPDAAP